MKPIMSRHEWITLILIVLCGLFGALLFETLGDLGEWLANFLVIPPIVYYLFFGISINKKSPGGGSVRSN